VKTEFSVQSRIVKAEPWREIVLIALSIAAIEGRNERIDIAVPGVVLFIRIQLIAKAETEG
jgi:hypothetical protein